MCRITFFGQGNFHPANSRSAAHLRSHENGNTFACPGIFLAHHRSHDTAFAESFTTRRARVFTAAELAVLARQWLVTEITQTTSAAVKVRIEDATPSSGTVGTGKGSTWIAMTLAGRRQSGPKRSSAAQRGAT